MLTDIMKIQKVLPENGQPLYYDEVIAVTVQGSRRSLLLCLNEQAADADDNKAELKDL